MRTPNLTSVLVVLTASVAGCHSGLISVRGTGSDAGPAGPTDAGGPSAAMFFASRVEGMLDDRCGGCHADGRSAPDFLRPDPDVRTTLLAYPALIDLMSPRTSRLLAKGEHTGPAFTPTEARDVQAWIELEAAEGTMVMMRERELATMPVEIREGFNALPLDPLGIPATSIHFVASRVGEGVFLDGVQIAAGPMGARLDHPVFVTWIEGTPHPDPIDRFADVTLEVEPNSSQAFDTGTVIITELPEGALLSIHFRAVGPMMTPVPPGTDAGIGMTTSGCTELAAFRANAVPALTGSCTGCHAGGNPSATASMDMTRVASMMDAQALMGCNQILGRISPAAPEASGLFTQPAPGSMSGHDFSFRNAAELAAFRASILAWYSLEAP